MSAKTNRDDEAWVCTWVSEDRESQLIGNPAGFRVLKKKIEEVLEAGAATGDWAIRDWAEFKLVADDPRAKKKPRKPFRDLLALLVVATIVAGAMFVFFAGVAHIWSWFK